MRAACPAWPCAGHHPQTAEGRVPAVLCRWARRCSGNPGPSLTSYLWPGLLTRGMKQCVSSSRWKCVLVLCPHCKHASKPEPAVPGVTSVYFYRPPRPFPPRCPCYVRAGAQPAAQEAFPLPARGTSPLRAARQPPAHCTRGCQHGGAPPKAPRCPAPGPLQCPPLGGAVLAAGSCFSCKRDEAASGSAAGGSGCEYRPTQTRLAGRAAGAAGPHTPSHHAGAAWGCQKEGEPRHELTPGTGGLWHPLKCPLGLGRHQGHIPTQTLQDRREQKGQSPGHGASPHPSCFALGPTAPLLCAVSGTVVPCT